jgi:UDP-glucose 4-epimerase
MNILITGGTGFIGSHTVVELLLNGHSVHIIDNLSNSDVSVLDSIAKITGIKPMFSMIDLLDYPRLSELFENNNFDAVVHFAGVKAVGESVAVPLKYYNNNVVGTYNLLSCMIEHSVNKLIFSSSATVYGSSDIMPLVETSATSPMNPYGRTKLYIEEMCKDICASNTLFSVALLRYFNPVGAHPSGQIGENPLGIPNNLFPIITQVAIGIRDKLMVFGDNYPTADGTGIRDYIHVVDLAKGHVKALDYILQHSGSEVFNLGTGTGYSVIEVIRTFERVNGVKIHFEITEKRLGDVSVCYSDTRKAKEVLGWKAELNLEDMCQDGWRFQKHKSNEQNINND